jgi:hypothetical protein
VTRVRAADGTRWIIRRRAFVRPRWRKRRRSGEAKTVWDGLDGLDGLGALAELPGGEVLGIIGAIMIGVIVVSALVLFLLPVLAFGAELLLLPFLALLFRGARVVEARNETTGDVLRFPVHGRAEARERERSLAAELGR